jgi:tetratricopeptide (TPR) repeat protein
VAQAHKELGAIALTKGDFAAAPGHFGAALELLERALATAPDDHDALREKADVYRRFTNYHRDHGKSEDAVATSRKALAIYDQLLQRDHDDDWVAEQKVLAESGLGENLNNISKREEALTEIRAGVAVARHLHEKDPDNVRWMRQLGGIEVVLGEMLFNRGEIDAALRADGDAVALEEQVVSRDPANEDARVSLATDYGYLAGVEAEARDFPSARRHIRGSLDVLEALAAKHPKVGKWQRRLWYSHLQAGEIDFVVAPARALDSYRAAADIMSKVLSADPASSLFVTDLALTRMRVGETLHKLHRTDEALATLTETERTLTSGLQKQPDDSSMIATRLEVEIALAEVEHTRGHLDRALEHLATAREHADAALAKSPDERSLLEPMLNLNADLGAYEGEKRGAGGVAVVRAAYEKALAIGEALRARHQLMPEIAERLADVKKRLRALPPPRN